MKLDGKNLKDLIAEKISDIYVASFFEYLNPLDKLHEKYRIEFKIYRKLWVTYFDDTIYREMRVRIKENSKYDIDEDFSEEHI